MANLSRTEIKAHEEACALLALDRNLTIDEVIEVIEKWHEGACHANNRNSAHFTPFSLAESLCVEIPTGSKILDLCAGIGTLSVAASLHNKPENEQAITMVEINPDYAAVAQKLLPHAEVIIGSIFDKGLQEELAARKFDCVISNPPYGTFSSTLGEAPRYSGREGHYLAIDIASELADYGIFLLPQQATPFLYSGRNGFSIVPDTKCPKYVKFAKETDIDFQFNCGIDTSFAATEWRDVKITTEIVVCDFLETRKKRGTKNMPLFSVAA